MKIFFFSSRHWGHFPILKQTLKKLYELLLNNIFSEDEIAMKDLQEFPIS